MKRKWDEHWGNKEARVTITKKRMIKILNSYINGKILDAGCGTGFFSKHFSDKDCKVFALDYSKQALKITRKLDKKINLVDGSIFKLPFKNESFDFVFSDGLLEHYKNPKKILIEFKRVLKSNGMILTFVPNKYSYWIFVKPFKLKDIEEYRFTLNELIELHENINLKIINSGGFSVFPLKYSPEFLGKYVGRIVYAIGKKVI